MTGGGGGQTRDWEVEEEALQIIRKEACRKPPI